MSLKYIFYHLLFWVSFTIAYAVSEWGYQQPLQESFNYHLLLLPGRLITVYINWFLLIPLFLYKNKRGYYLISLLGLLCLAAVAHRYFVMTWGYPTYFPSWATKGHADHILKPSRLIQHALAFFFPVVITTLFRIFKDWYDQRNAAEELKKEKVEAELKFLKSQTNPHFLFNTLNSIYGLALEKSPKTPNLILKLSDILSYTLYESDTERIALRKELDLIENIIELEKERFGRRLNIEFKVEGNPDLIKIPPLILVPFVENAFKHGIKNEVNKGWIRILVKASEKELYFAVENSVPTAEKQQTEGGLGLKNIARRLELIYGENQKLYIERRNDSFLVNLSIEPDSDEI